MSATATLAPHSARIGALSRLGDETLAARAAAGSDAAFTTLYERYHGPLLGYCRSILLDDEDARDATQNALENMLRSLPRREPGRPLRPWLYRIAHNEAINIVRRRQPHAELRELDEPTVPGPEVDAEQRVRLAQLVDDLRGLPERQRGALVMRELSGLSYDEIALALGVSNEAARRAVFDARGALHEAVDGRATACVSVRHCISDGDRRRLRARRIRAHLRSCDDCASFQRAIHARSADLHLLGPWFSGAALASMLGGGAGGGALVAVGGGGAATVTLAGWSSMPVFLKGLTVAAVVATTGTAAVEIKHVAKPAVAAPKTQAARPAPAPASPTATALQANVARAAAKTSAPRSRGAKARSARGTLRSRAGAGTLVAAHGETPATPAPKLPSATAPAPAPPVPVPVSAAAPAPQQSAQQAPAGPRPTAKTPAQLAIQQLTDIREQVLAALHTAQTTATSGTTSALQSASTTLQGSLGALRTTIDRMLAAVGLKLPAPTATRPGPPSSSPSLPKVLAPVQQVLGGIDSMLSQLFGRPSG